MLLKMNLNVKRNGSKTEIRSAGGKRSHIRLYMLLYVITTFVLSLVNYFCSAALPNDTKYGWYLILDVQTGRKRTPLCWVCWHSTLKLLCCKRLDAVSKEKDTVGQWVAPVTGRFSSVSVTSALCSGFVVKVLLTPHMDTSSPHYWTVMKSFLLLSSSFFTLWNCWKLFISFLYLGVFIVGDAVCRSLEGFMLPSHAPFRNSQKWGLHVIQCWFV